MGSFRVRRIVLFSAVLALTGFSASTNAQSGQLPRAPSAVDPDPSRDWSDDVPAHLSVVEGQVTLERDGRLEPAEANLALLAGDRLRTIDGRVEILYADGSTLAVDKNTEIDLLSDSLVRLQHGGLRIAIARTTEDLEYRVDAPAGSVAITAAGEYRMETGVDREGDPNVDLMVYRGSAELFNEHGRTLVRAGRHAMTTANTEPSLPYAANSAARDEFDTWVEDQREARIGPVSAGYLPEEVRSYSGTFDTYGSWDYEPTYGQVWYPRVDVGWRPYSQGRWSYTGHFGWIWVGIDRWSWPTHHFGRWGFSSERWYWIPDRRWAPAWVSWGGAPGYVSWCPLGFDGRPVIGFRSINAFNRNPWSAWTVMPARHFTHNVWVSEHAVGQNAIEPQSRTAFVERPGAPLPAGAGVPRREIAPLRAPTWAKDAAGTRTRTDTGPFDGARTKGTTGAASPRGPISSTIVGAPVRSDESRPVAGAKRAVPNDPPSPPDRTTTTGPARGPKSPSAIEVPRAELPSTGAKRYEPPASVPRKSEPPPDSRAILDTSRPSPPSTKSRQVDPDRYAPPPPSAAEPPRNRGQAIDRTAPPPPSQPVQRGKSAEPPQASSAPPPARNKVEPAPPSAPPPASGGAGTGSGSGKGRGRGGGRG